MYVHRENKRRKVIMSMDLFSEDEHLEMKVNNSIVVHVHKIDDAQTCFLRNYRDIEWIERGSRLRGLPHDAKISIYSGIASKLELQAESLVSVGLVDIKSMELDFTFLGSGDLGGRLGCTQIYERKMSLLHRGFEE